MLEVEKPTPELGETLLALDAVGMAEGFLVLRGQMTVERLAPLLAGTVAEGYEVVGDEPGELRERLLALKPATVEGETLVDVDSCFAVKGIGVVVLGVVRRGTLAKGQQLQLYPGKRLVQIRSIQVHDNDVREAGSGCRVGLAVKNAEVGHFERGSVLAIPQSQQLTSRLELEIQAWPYFKEGFSVDMVFHLGAGLQLVPARVINVAQAAGPEGSARLTLDLEKPLTLHPGHRLILSYLNAKGPRIAGKVIGWSIVPA